MTPREMFQNDYRDARTGFWRGLANRRMIRATGCRMARRRYDGLAVSYGVSTLLPHILATSRLDAARIGPKGRLP